MSKQALSYIASRKVKQYNSHSRVYGKNCGRQTLKWPPPSAVTSLYNFLPLSVCRTYELLLMNRCHIYDYVTLCKTPFGACLLYTFRAGLMKWPFVKAHSQQEARAWNNNEINSANNMNELGSRYFHSRACKWEHSPADILIAAL